MNKIIDFHHTLEEILQSIYCSEEMARALTHMYSADGIAGNWATGYGIAASLSPAMALPASWSPMKHCQRLGLRLWWIF
jgi:hypothetical protein